MKHIHETFIKVRYAETDQMGIVHHAVYPVWFELGRTEYLESKGLKYTDFENMGYYLPLIEIKCNYKSSSKYGDTLLLKTYLSKLNSRFADFTYELFNENRLICTGLTKHVCTDKKFKPSRFSDIIFGVLKK